MSLDTLDISGLDKATLLAALWNNATAPPAWFKHSGPTPSFLSKTEAAQILATMGYDFDYLKGRILKLNLSADEFHFWLYDRDNGSGMAKRVVDNLRAGGRETDRV
jgi:hypothetical protein